MTPRSDVILTVRVIPRAARSAIAGSRDNALLVRLTAPPVDGAANAELIRVLADALDVPKRNITLLSGDRARLKRVKITGLTDDEVARKLSCIPQTS